MNYLGHLYFSKNDHTLMYANLFGDFVKGSDLSAYPSDIRKGIRLHRMIDQYIDHHPAVVELMQQLYPSLPKVTGIAVDLYFDHLLASRWSEFHPKPYRDFLNDFYAYPIELTEGFSPNFITFTIQLKKYDWMIHYATREGLGKMCEGVGSKLSFANALQGAPGEFDQHRKMIEKAFELYMQDAIPYFETVAIPD